ncbi:hypothetical protein BJ912DRAFT_929862 [Pholiota molesta]|nr:hypothetical protein BJ912DRAFT_929862 [Pholiota molesta]
MLILRNTEKDRKYSAGEMKCGVRQCSVAAEPHPYENICRNEFDGQVVLKWNVHVKIYTRCPFYSELLLAENPPSIFDFIPLSTREAVFAQHQRGRYDRLSRWQFRRKTKEWLRRIEFGSQSVSIFSIDVHLRNTAEVSESKHLSCSGRDRKDVRGKKQRSIIRAQPSTLEGKAYVFGVRGIRKKSHKLREESEGGKKAEKRQMHQLWTYPFNPQLSFILFFDVSPPIFDQIPQFWWSHPPHIHHARPHSAQFLRTEQLKVAEGPSAVLSLARLQQEEAEQPGVDDGGGYLKSTKPFQVTALRIHLKYTTYTLQPHLRLPKKSKLPRSLVYSFTFNTHGTIAFLDAGGRTTSLTGFDTDRKCVQIELEGGTKRGSRLSKISNGAICNACAKGCGATSNASANARKVSTSAPLNAAFGGGHNG